MAESRHEQCTPNALVEHGTDGLNRSKPLRKQRVDALDVGEGAGKLTRQGDFGVEVESMTDNRADTKRWLTADGASAAKLAENRGSQTSGRWTSTELSGHPATQLSTTRVSFSSGRSSR